MKTTKRAPKSAGKTTWNDLAERLGFNRRSITSWRKLTGAPTTPDRQQWLVFIAENGLGLAGNRVGQDRERVLTQIGEERLASMQHDRAVREKRYVLRSDVAALHHRVGTLQKLKLYSALEREYPGKVVGRTAAEISMIGRALADELADVFQQEEQSWNDTAPSTESP